MKTDGHRPSVGGPLEAADAADIRLRTAAAEALQTHGQARVRFLPITAYTATNAPVRAPSGKRRKGRNPIMFGFIGKRQKTHYREAMRQLQPFATETSSLWLSGHYRGVNLLVPDFSRTQSPRNGERREH
jgi:hypothetical protein